VIKLKIKPMWKADMQYTVSNLVPETIYMFQIIARNDLGDSLSKSLKCTTDQSMYTIKLEFVASPLSMQH
jgi:hypothetical protein